MPTGKVKWFDAEKGFGFLSQESGPDVYCHADALPEGVTTLKNGTRVEFGIAQGRRGDQALQVRILEEPASVSRNQRDQRSHQRQSPPVGLFAGVTSSMDAGMVVMCGSGYERGGVAGDPAGVSRGELRA